MKRRNPRPDAPNDGVLVERIRVLEADVTAAHSIVRALIPFAEAMSRGTCGCAALPNDRACTVCEARMFMQDWKAATT